jgi:carboxymethylenebutenolidase
MRMSRKILLILSLLLFLETHVFAVEKTMIYGLGTKKNMQAELIAPAGKGPFPGVLILHTSGGVQDGEISFATHLSEQGYVCLIPYYFDAYGITHNTRHLITTRYAEDIFNDFVELLEYLKKNPKVKPEKLGAVGFSMGGYWALILAAKGKIKAGVSYYGALTGGGKNLDLKYRFDDIFDKDDSPVLILHGSQDSVVSARHAANLAVLLDEKKSPYELRIYIGAEHRYERAPNRDDDAANDSWKRTLEFFKKYLKGNKS